MPLSYPDPAVYLYEWRHDDEGDQEPVHRYSYRWLGKKALKKQAIDTGRLLGWCRWHRIEPPYRAECFWEALTDGSLADAVEIDEATSTWIVEKAVEARRAAYQHTDCGICQTSDRRHLVRWADEESDTDGIAADSIADEIYGRPETYVIWEHAL